MPTKKIPRVTKTRKGKIVTKRNDFINTKTIKDMFKKKIIHGIAKTTGFVQRQSKLNVYDFFYL